MCFDLTDTIPFIGKKTPSRFSWLLYIDIIKCTRCQGLLSIYCGRYVYTTCLLSIYYTFILG
jgi:hypothetical protein